MPNFYDFSRSVKIKKKIFNLFVTVRELDGRRSDAPVSVVLCVCELPEKASHARGMGPTYPSVQTVLHDPLKRDSAARFMPINLLHLVIGVKQKMQAVIGDRASSKLHTVTFCQKARATVPLT
jgi:hypothetical protein